MSTDREAFQVATQATKYQQIASYVKQQIEEGHWKVGDQIPSLSAISKQFGTARETAVKAYKLLKKENLLDSLPGKGYFVLSDEVQRRLRLFLLINHLTPSMEIFYEALRKNLPPETTLDLSFHHHIPELFEKELKAAQGRYNYYLIKPFDHPRVEAALELVDKRELVLVDRNDFEKDCFASVCQDFCQPLQQALLKIHKNSPNYQYYHLVLSESNPHPLISCRAFDSLCRKYAVEQKISTSVEELALRRDGLYLVLSEADLAHILKLCKEKSLLAGKDIGILIWNESPLLEFVNGGIATLSADFKKMGKKVAEVVSQDKALHVLVPSKLILRQSIWPFKD